MTSNKRRLGQTDIFVTPIAMGCWPITGITSLDVNEQDSLATLEAALDAGINFFDTAYAYGYQGESERMIAQALGHRREEIVIASKGGLFWHAPGQQALDGSPATLRKHCEESLKRLQMEQIDLYYLHAPDPDVPVSESAGALRELMDEGKVRSIGVSNFDVGQLKSFHVICPITACQPHYNMLQREIELDVLPWCVENQVSICVYWPLLKGLLAGKLPRNHVFDAKDGRKKYPMFQGEEWNKNQDFLDLLRPIAEEAGKPLAQLVLNWTIQQKGITSALVGAKRPQQIRENAETLNWQLTSEQMSAIDDALKQRGAVVSQRAVP